MNHENFTLDTDAALTLISNKLKETPRLTLTVLVDFDDWGCWREFSQRTIRGATPVGAQRDALLTAQHVAVITGGRSSVRLVLDSPEVGRGVILWQFMGGRGDTCPVPANAAQLFPSNPFLDFPDC